MKISIISIECERDELSGILRDFDPEEFKVRVNPVKESVKDVLQSIGGGKMNGLASNIPTLADRTVSFPLPKPFISRDKVCSKCGAHFHDKSVNNKATKCDVCRFPVGNNGKTTGYKPPRIVKPGIGITGKKVCIVCGKDFEPNSNRQLRCSVSCGMKPKVKNETVKTEKVKAVKEKKELPPRILDCKECGKTFTDLSENRRGIYCSEECQYKAKRKRIAAWNNAHYVSKKTIKPAITSAPIETIKPEPKPLPDFKRTYSNESKLPATKPLIDNTENGEMRKRKPANDRPPIVLRSGDRICKNPKCKKIFRFEKLDQVLCGECEPVKVKEVEHDYAG
jgi:hypothetical protein